MQVVKAGVSNPMPDDSAKLNNDSTNGGQVTNSWARWAPFVQAYKQGQLLWLTMSSTRSYGVRIENDGAANCYPKESPNGAPYSTRVFTTTNLNPACSRAQLWMAAVKLDANGVASGQDVSFPAFWLPFQDQTTNNHLGQWAQRSYSGTCNPAAADAGAAHGALWLGAEAGHVGVVAGHPASSREDASTAVPAEPLSLNANPSLPSRTGPLTTPPSPDPARPDPSCNEASAPGDGDAALQLAQPRADRNENRREFLRAEHGVSPGRGGSSLAMARPRAQIDGGRVTGGSSFTLPCCL